MNLGKSVVVEVEMEDRVKKLAREVNCRAGELPMTYLRLLVGANTKSKKL